MSEVLMIPDSCNRGCNNNSSMDAALLMSLMNGGCGGGNWMWIMFLFFLEPLLRNGFFGNGGFGNGGANGFSSLLNSVDGNAGRELLSQAIHGNGDAIANLASMFSTSTDFIKQAICGLDKAITQTSGQIGITGQQMINAVDKGVMTVTSQLASCCCDIREAVTKGNYDNQIATLNQTNTLKDGQNFINRSIERGFAESSYATRDQTCQINSNIQAQTQSLKDAGAAGTNAILAKLDAMEKTAMQNKIDALLEANSGLKTQLNLEHQNALTAQAIAAATAPINAQLQEIKCAQPNTVTVPYYPFRIEPSCGCNGGNYQNQFWY